MRVTLCTWPSGAQLVTDCVTILYAVYYNLTAYMLQVCSGRLKSGEAHAPAALAEVEPHD